MELIDKKKLRDSLVREQARYILSDRMTDKHISAGFMLSIVELDCQPTVDAISVDWLRERASRMLDFGEGVERIIQEWKDEQSK